MKNNSTLFPYNFLLVVVEGIQVVFFLPPMSHKIPLPFPFLCKVDQNAEMPSRKEKKIKMSISSKVEVGRY
jgi:hypothetical protein